MMILSNYKALLVIFLLSFKVVAAEEVPSVPVFDNEPAIFSNTGHLRLLWQIEPSELPLVEFELQRSEDALFTEVLTLYKGPDRGSFISGLNNGKYFFRVRALNKDSASLWSPSVVLTVKHHSLRFALMLFGIGGLVFLLTVGMLLEGTRKTNHET